MGSIGTSRSSAGRNTASQQSQPQTPKGPTLQDFQNTSPADLGNLMNTVNKTTVKMGISSRLQKTIQHFNMNEKPTVLDDASFDSAVSSQALDGQTIYRGVYGNQQLTADQMNQYLMYGDNTLVGRGIHGDGLYFSTRLNTGRGYSDGTPGSVTTAYIDKSKAKSITEGALRRMYVKESAAVQSAFGSFPGNRPTAVSTSVMPQYALYKGYNVIHVPGGNRGGYVAHVNNSYGVKNGGEDYYVPLTRSVLVFREHSK